MNKDIAKALDEITAVLKKHDMAGLVLVANPTHVDWRMHISPSWSCARFEEATGGGVMLRVRAKKEDFPTVADQKLCLERTVGTFVTFQDTMRALEGKLDDVLVMLSQHVNFMGRSDTEDEGFHRE